MPNHEPPNDPLAFVAFEFENMEMNDVIAASLTEVINFDEIDLDEVINLDEIDLGNVIFEEVNLDEVW